MRGIQNMWIGLETHSLPLHEQGTYCHSFRPTRVCVCVHARVCAQSSLILCNPMD